MSRQVQRSERERAVVVAHRRRANELAVVERKTREPDKEDVLVHPVRNEFGVLEVVDRQVTKVVLIVQV